MLIVVASPRGRELASFVEALHGEGGAEVALAQSGRECLGLVSARAPALVVVDQHLPDMTPLELVTSILRANAMINTALLTMLDPEEFHEWSEGLGILCSLPMMPSETDAAELLAKMRGLGL